LLPGQTVVVQGTGGVSIFALQIAHAAGANVIATSSSDAKLKTAIFLGADYAINYSTTPQWSKVVREKTGGRGADNIIDVGGSSTIAESFKAIRFGGIISQIGALPARGEVEKVDASVRAIQTQGIIRGILVGGRDVFEDLVRGLDKSRWHPVVDKVFEFEQAKGAFDYLKVRPFMDCAHRVAESKTSRKSCHSRIIKDGIEIMSPQSHNTDFPETLDHFVVSSSISCRPRLS
jgi:NADPH:quinone reductase-like Zn-dependent oxidoreductase